MIRDALVLGEIAELGLFDLDPVLGSALHGVAVLLLRGHVRPADPVLVLPLTLQVLHRVACHLPRYRPWTTMLSNPLLPRDAVPQKHQGEEHGGKLFLKKGK